jgi:hypothetical protein
MHDVVVNMVASEKRARLRGAWERGCHENKPKEVWVRMGRTEIQ